MKLGRRELLARFTRVGLGVLALPALWALPRALSFGADVTRGARVKRKLRERRRISRVVVPLTRDALYTDHDLAG